ncbi:hypothetical protein HanPI659440_Chr03g0116061 [Helianthus annuus]|nr:hypothetical protein HanPI659440_Chr03g0116061 [Helianthus annuus]
MVYFLQFKIVLVHPSHDPIHSSRYVFVKLVIQIILISWNLILIHEWFICRKSMRIEHA